MYRLSHKYQGKRGGLGEGKGGVGEDEGEWRRMGIVDAVGCWLAARVPNPEARDFI